MLPKSPPVAEPSTDMDTDDMHDAPPMQHVDDIQSELKSRAHMAKAGGSEAYESDEDEDGMPRGQRVQCAQS